MIKNLLNQLNQFGQKKIPFLFIIDFELKNYYVSRLDQIDKHIFFSIDGMTNIKHEARSHYVVSQLKKKPINFAQYTRSFNKIIAEMIEGNTYLLNLTAPTEIEIPTSLLNIFHASQAPFRLYFKNQFITFSPERFIRIENDLIKTYPMKGTINAIIPNAQHKILADKKEKAEHTMVVDLLRNDLSIVAKNVKVNKFRYIDKIKAGSSELLQVSSEIVGSLEHSWPERIGDILLSLLPAGSISGTPKRKTLEIIHNIEAYQRGFFTGVFGYYNGTLLDSGVMIRFIERQGNKFIYKSGGGITIDSILSREYEEMLEKVYIPFDTTY
ncbi:MAG: aminodeoxychorismate synthase component I [Thiomargarita sp.]|nr:aminodeoxychorismate synthase component I [Thiomargarita sp.]